MWFYKLINWFKPKPKVKIDEGCVFQPKTGKTITEKELFPEGMPEPPEVESNNLTREENYIKLGLTMERGVSMRKILEQAANNRHKYWQEKYRLQQEWLKLTSPIEDSNK